MTTPPKLARSELMFAIALLIHLTVLAKSPSADSGQPQEGNKERMEKTESGLRYFDLQDGTGERPDAKQICIVHYTGWLWENGAKGKMFDSSEATE